MIITVFSDSHGDYAKMDAVIQKTHPDMVIHLGDGVYDAMDLESVYENTKFEYIYGNCDYRGKHGYNNGSPVEKVITIGDLKLYMTHGHIYGVKSGIERIMNIGAAFKADIILFGHTHRVCNLNENGIRLFNPGSIAGGFRSGWQSTYGIIEVKDNNFLCKIEKSK